MRRHVREVHKLAPGTYYGVGSGLHKSKSTRGRRERQLRVKENRRSNYKEDSVE